MINAIGHDTKMRDAKELLDCHGVSCPFGWEIAIGMLLQDCDHISVDGFGSNAVFVLHEEAELSGDSGNDTTKGS